MSANMFAVFPSSRLYTVNIGTCDLLTPHPSSHTSEKNIILLQVEYSYLQICWT